MADDPAARPTAAQAHAALRAIAYSGRPVATRVEHIPAGVQKPHPAAPPRDGKQPRRRVRVATAVAAAVTVVAGLVAAVVVLPEGAPGGAGPSVPAATPTTEAPDTAVIADPTTADPCSLVDLAPLQAFGTASLDAEVGPFAGCGARIERSDGTRATYALAFQNELEVAKLTDGRRTHEAGYTVISYNPIERYCDQYILLGDGHAIQLAIAGHEGWTGPTDMCGVLDAARAAVLTQLTSRGIGVRTPLTATSPLAGISSCSLLAAEDLSGVVANPSPPRPSFADWGCEWSSYSGDSSVELIYQRTGPLDPPSGTPTDLAGRRGLVHEQPGYCWVSFDQHTHDVGGSAHVEAIWVTYQGPGTDAELCRAATALATAAARRLPPPS
jgi:hypothetical protein